MTVRPRRSVLYMPGSNARALEKAKTLAVDGIILDLEDSVAPEAKEAARRQVCDAVRAGGFGQREVMIRVNGTDTPWHADDLSAAAHAAPDAIVVPKVSSPEHARVDRPAAARHGHTAQDTGLGDDRDAARALQHPRHRRRGARFRDAPLRLHHGHQRPRQGHAGAIGAWPRADAAVAVDVRRRGTHPRRRHSRWRLQRYRQRRRIFCASASRASTSASTARR